jgi:hypothetical protein
MNTTYRWCRCSHINVQWTGRTRQFAGNLLLLHSWRIVGSLCKNTTYDGQCLKITNSSIMFQTENYLIWNKDDKQTNSDEMSGRPNGCIDHGVLLSTSQLPIDDEDVAFNRTASSMHWPSRVHAVAKSVRSASIARDWLRIHNAFASPSSRLKIGIHLHKFFRKL